MNTTKNNVCRSGAALFVVLFIVMAATVLALCFIASSETELACGQNMILRAQMDSLAESGLVHARGLILNPQDVDETLEYWTGAEGLQLVSGSDWYDVAVIRDSNDYCNYIIDCNAYRLKNGEELGRGSLRAGLRLDPCIAFWAGTNTTLANSIVINGDVYCGGNLTNNADINGDVFTDGTVSGVPLGGQHYPAADANVLWPGNVISISDLSSDYYIDGFLYTVTPVDFNSWPSAGGSNPKKVYYCDHELEVNNVNIDGTLVVNANLIITGTGNSITAEKNFPALLVNGKLTIRGKLEINGLAIVTQQVVVEDPNAAAFSVDIRGGLFIQNGSLSAPSSATQRINISASPQKAAIRKWPAPAGDPEDWFQASGAFFKSITMF